MDNILKPYLNRHIKYNWALGVGLILLFGLPRFLIVLQSYVDRSYLTVMFVFICMWAVPWILLTKYGRTKIGIKRPSSWWKLGVSFFSGMVACFAIFYLSSILFGHSIENPFVYIGGNNPGSTISGDDKLIYFIIAVIPSMIFSPVGEEFLYRGLIHGSFTPRFTETQASIFDSLAFSLTHIAHFGIVYTVGQWQFLPIPTIVWVISMFGVSQLFFRCKVYSQSIWGAVASHSGFNFAMMYGIFFLL